jgi:hypothetical protein
MKKNKIRNVLDLGRIPVTSIEVAKPETGSEFRARLQQAEEARRLRPLKEAEAQLSQTLTALHKEWASFWSLPLEQLRHADGDAFAANFVALGLPTMQSDAEPTALAQFAKDVFEKFCSTLPTRTGYRLTESGAIRFSTFLQSQIYSGGVLLTPSALQQIWDWMQRYEVFAPAPEDLTFDPNMAPVEPQAEPTPESFETLLSKSDGTRATDARLRRALQNEVVGTEFADIWSKWTESLYSNFGVSLTKVQHEAAWRFFQDMNLSPMKLENYDASRRHLVGRLLLPETCLTTREVLDRQMRRGELSPTQYIQQCRTYELQGTLDKARAQAGI